MSAVNVKRSLLALILTVLLVASMLPQLTYSALAATKYYSVTGVVSDATMNTITITKNGKYRTFGKEGAKILRANDGIALKDTVKIVYSAENPQDAVQIIMVSHSTSTNRVPHDSHVLTSVTGVISDATMNVITITTTSGTLSFGKEDAHLFNARDGLLLGDKIRITYYEDIPTEAVQIYLVERAINTDSYQPEDTHTNSRFIGDILAVGDGYFVCQDMQTGIVVTFFYDAVHYEGDLEVGDSVMVLFDQQYPSIATRIMEINDNSGYGR